MNRIRATLRSSGNWGHALMVLYILLVGEGLFAAFSHWHYDDPFITYRYADNLAHGLGFVYNRGERVLSTTTPFFALLLAGLSFLWCDIPTLANLVGAFSLAMGGYLLWDLAHSWKAPVVGRLCLLTYPTFPLLIWTLSSEIPLYLAFCLGGFATYARKRYLLSALFIALAILTRPDAVLVLLAIGIDFVIHKPAPIPVRGILLLLALTISWFLFAWLYFGSPLPATLAARQHQASIASGREFATDLYRLITAYANNGYFKIELGLALLGVIALPSLYRTFGGILLWAGLYFISYILLEVAGPFWYFAALVPAFLTLVGLGVSLLQRFLVSAMCKLRLQKGLPPLVTLLTLAIAISLSLAQIYTPWKIRDRFDSRYPIYRAVGEWLRVNTPPEAKIGMLEIGIIGYYSQRPVVDFAGLLHPAIVAQLTPGNTYDDSAQWAIQKYKPAYLVLKDGDLSKIEQSYTSTCSLVNKFLGESYRYRGNISIYACNFK